MRAHLSRISTGDIIPRTFTANEASVADWSKSVAVIYAYTGGSHSFSTGFVSTMTSTDGDPGDGFIEMYEAEATMTRELDLTDIDVRAGDSVRFQARVALLEDVDPSQNLRARLYAVDSGGSRTRLVSGSNNVPVGGSAVIDSTVAVPSGYEHGFEIVLFHRGQAEKNGSSVNVQSRATFEDIIITLS